jgi:curved DNA-binding protein CbpA
MSPTLYDILGIPSSSTTEEIKAAYKKLAKQHHPDKNAGSNWHEEQFKKINQAYQVLSDASKRRQYDSRLEYEAFQQQNKTNGNNSRPTPKTEYKRSVYASKKSKSAKNSALYKIYLIIAGVFLFTGIAGYFFYDFMNHYTAEDLYKQAKELDKTGRYKEAFMLYTDALSFDNKYSEAYEKRAVASINAIEDYKSAEYDYTNAIIYSKEPSANLYFKRAKCLLHLKKYNLAIIDLDSVLSINHSADSAVFYKAEINYFIENYRNAIPDYSLFLTRHPSSSESLLKRSFCYYKNEQYQEALNDFEQLHKLKPEDGETYYYSAFTHFALKDSIKGCNDLNYAYIMGFGEANNALKMYCK